MAYEVELQDETKKVINRQFLGFYFTNLRKVRELLRRKHGVVDLVLLHFDIKMGPVLAGTNDLLELLPHGVKVVKQVDDKFVDKYPFLLHMDNAKSNLDDNKEGKNFRLLLDNDQIVFEIISIKFEKGSRGELFLLVIVNNKKLDKKKAEAIKKDYCTIIEKYLDPLEYRKYSLKDMSKVYDFIKEEIKIGKTAINESSLKKSIERYFLKDVVPEKWIK